MVLKHVYFKKKVLYYLYTVKILSLNNIKDTKKVYAVNLHINQLFCVKIYPVKNNAF